MLNHDELKLTNVEKDVDVVEEKLKKLCLLYVQSQSYVHGVVVGVDNEKQLTELMNNALRNSPKDSGDLSQELFRIGSESARLF